MEVEPQRESLETMWVNYGKLLMIMEVRDTLRDDWNGHGLKLWVDRKINELNHNEDQLEIEHGL